MRWGEKMFLVECGREGERVADRGRAWKGGEVIEGAGRLDCCRIWSSG